MKTRGNEEIVSPSDKEYFSDVIRLKYSISMLMKKHNLINNVIVENSPEKIIPYYGRIANNGTYAVEFSCGVPRIICTPYGSIEIESAKLCRGNLIDYKEFHKELDKVFGLVEIQPIIRNNMDLIGPRCAITMLPWKTNQVFPVSFDEISLRKKDFKIVAKEQNYLEILYNELDQYFKETGYQNVMFSNVKKQPVVVKKVEEPKKYHFILNYLKQFLKKVTTEKENVK
ncbi:MAG: hypothetical protein MJ054_00495 [Clostridia bacterium]|nr:hypothetical protein [Clostridia bacterium]